jgi:hypothetical protein
MNIDKRGKFSLGENIISVLRSIEYGLQFELYKLLITHFTLDSHRMYWQDNDELSDISIMYIRNAVDIIFKDYMEEYLYTPVWELLNNLKKCIYYGLRGGLNVAFPQRPNMYILSILDTIYDVYIDESYSNLQINMLLINNDVSLIQRCWRKYRCARGKID